MSIGKADGADEYLLTDVADLAVAKDGSIFIADRKGPIVRQYDASGKYVRSVGRLGAGPGEYRSVSGLALLPDGKLLVWDTGNWRVNVYSPAGASVGTWQIAANGTAVMARAIAVDTGGTVYVQRRIFARPPAASTTVWIRMRSDGTVIDTVGHPDVAGEPVGIEVKSPDGTSTARANRPFSPIPSAVFNPLGYFVTGFGDRYAFELLVPAGPRRASAPPAWAPGQPIVSVRRDAPPEPVSAAEREAARAMVEERMQRTNPSWKYSINDVPRTRPAYSRLWADLQGRVWVQRVPETTPVPGTFSIGMGTGRGTPRPAAELTAEPPKVAGRYDVFEPSGTFLGTVDLPMRVSFMTARGDQVWGIAYDDDDVVSVKRYRIVWK